MRVYHPAQAALHERLGILIGFDKLVKHYDTANQDGLSLDMKYVVTTGEEIRQTVVMHYTQYRGGGWWGRRGRWSGLVPAEKATSDKG